MEQIRHFDLLKAFGYIERVLKSVFFFSEKTYYTSYVRNMVWSTILNKYHGRKRCFHEDPGSRRILLILFGSEKTTNFH